MSHMDRAHLRLLDANFNRAREALRVMEDCARFLLDDSHLSALAKQLRHDLCQCIAQIPAEQLLGARDIIGDVGTSISTADEIARPGQTAVLQAAAKRLTEALRCLEEYSKIETPQIAREFEKLRYRAYDLEKRILLRTDPSNRLGRVRLYVLLTESLCRLPVMETSEQILAGGADCIQLREKDRTDAELLELACKIAQLCHQAGALFIMNDRPDLAVLAGADGVHLGQHDLTVDQARKIVYPRMIVGKSTHCLTEARSAMIQGPDYLAVGSVFPSPTKPQVTTCGLQLIRDIRRLYPGPLIAVGGITRQNAADAITAGATAVAACHAILTADSPRAATAAIKQNLPT
jgi:thiamine-phosphate pyrophosphorylase